MYLRVMREGYVFLCEMVETYYYSRADPEALVDLTTNLFKAPLGMSLLNEVH